jgi:hypothetical protein
VLHEERVIYVGENKMWWHKAELSWDGTEINVVGRLYLRRWALFDFNHYLRYIICDEN